MVARLQKQLYAEWGPPTRHPLHRDLGFEDHQVYTSEDKNTTDRTRGGELALFLTSVRLQYIFWACMMFFSDGIKRLTEGHFWGFLKATPLVLHM